MLLCKKLVGKTQIPQSQEYTNTFKQNLTCMFLPIRANSNYTLCNEGPCMYNLFLTRMKRFVASFKNEYQSRWQATLVRINGNAPPSKNILRY